ncbi:ankyrin repeat domain-containing protein [Candidatus Chromulinivorax destructor]|uniref:Uncharacterized protein n=1 Tax=Candidatus Chromulinivorax destructor TaxID=2066483 RepID=A0A345ZCF3_9BACT|nr:ankyrin repeat domain-containing protein [Candidatus Chromulinivorax destructor]AXK60970.1 hypothetical protein C0J27_04525 [Candidatus Chromulinivorax destructor]
MKSLKISALFFMMIWSFLYDSIYGAEKTFKLSDNKFVIAQQNKPFYEVSPLSLEAVEKEAQRSQEIQDIIIHFPWVEEGFNLLRNQEVAIESFYETFDRLLVIDLLDSQNRVIGRQGLAYKDVMQKVIQELFDAMKEPFINTLFDALGTYQNESYFNWATLHYMYHHPNQMYDTIFHYVLKYKDRYLQDELNQWFDELLNNPIIYQTIDFQTLYKFVFLLNASIDKQIINHSDDQGLTFLDYAIMDNNVACVKYLLQNGAQVLEKDGFTNVLHIAVLHGYQEIVYQLLLSNPHIVNSLDAQQKTSLHLAAGYGFYNIANILLKNGANPNISSDDDGVETPLLSAIQNNPVSIKMIELLLDSGAKINNRVDHQGISLLGYAINYPEIVKLLLQSGADANLPDLDEDGLIKIPLLHKAVLNQNVSVMRILLDYRADINALGGITGGTALHEAVELCSLKIVDFLLQYDADKNILDDQGVTPYELAKYKLDDLHKDLDKARKMKSSSQVITQVEDEIKEILAIIDRLS